jgi:hypothetical protein
MYYHVKVQKPISLTGISGDWVRGGEIHYIRCATWDIVENEIRLAASRQVTVLEVRDSGGKLCPW